MLYQSDATYAYRGYRLQALYILWRILNDTEDGLVFQPEGMEDLAIFNADGDLIEVVQVKAFSNNLTLSSFEPDKPSSLFYRVHEYLADQPDLKVNIVSFGKFGHSLYRALTNEDAEKHKLAQDLSLYNFLSENQATKVIEVTHPIQVSEQQIHQDVATQLGESLLGEPENAFEMLSYWIYVCSEKKLKITRLDLIDKMNKVGEFINARAAYQREWLTSIVPIEDNEVANERRSFLKEQFYEGVAARYEHILADLDVPRLQKLQQIHEAFSRENVVIVHGASGQGKTTLAFRYLRDYCPKLWRFFVHSPESRSQALSIARAISHHAHAIDIPLLVYLDVRPSETNWTETVRELALLPNIRLLITIREDDLRRASFAAIDFHYELYELLLDAEEARRIYEVLIETKRAAKFTDFDVAWQRFGEKRLLMEFVHLITQGTSLQDRLKQQVKAIENEVMAGQLDESAIRLLRLVAIASSFGARLKRKRLVEALSLKTPSRLIERLEKEYLIKINEDQLLVDGVHPIRSNIVKSLLVDEYTEWSSDLGVCLKCIYEADLGAFLLEIFGREPDLADLVVNILDDIHPSLWVGIAGVVRSLVWLGIRRFVSQNESILGEAYQLFGIGGTLFLNPDIAQALPNSEELIDNLGKLDIAQRAVTKAKDLTSKLQGQKHIFGYAKNWLDTYDGILNEPDTLLEWLSLAESVFWVHHLQADWSIDEWIQKLPFAKVIPQLPLDVLADIGAAMSHKKGITHWHRQYEEDLLKRFKESTNTVLIESDGSKAIVHYVLDIQGTYNFSTTTDPIHSESIRRIRWFADLFPRYQIIGSRGYGHRIVEFNTLDSSYNEGIDRVDLPLKWLVWVNSVYSGLFYWSNRPEDWQEHVGRVIKLRQEIVDLLIKYQREIEKYFKSQNLRDLYQNLVVPNREFVVDELKQYPLLPKSAVDEWGLNAEGAENDHPVNSIAKSIITAKGIFIEKFVPYSTSLRKYLFSISNFFDHSEHALFFTKTGVRIISERQRKNVFQLLAQHGFKETSILLSITNLADAWEKLPVFQKEFRNLLTPFVGSKQLSRLERQEHHAYQRLWALWYFFASEPYLIEKNPDILFPRVFNDQLDTLKQRLIFEFNLRLSEDVVVNLLDYTVNWDSEKVGVIILDSFNGWKLYQELRENIREIIEAFAHDVKFHSVEFYTIQLNLDNLLLLPLVNGKLINQAGYHVRALTPTGTFDLGELNYALQPIPNEVMEQLLQRGIYLHTGDGVALARKLLEKVANLHAFVAHLHELVTIPDLEGDNVSFLQEYVNRISLELSDLINNLVDNLTDFVEIVLEKEFRSLDNKDLAVEAIKILRNSLFGEIKDSRMQLEQFGEWRSQLVNALGAALALCAAMASDE